LCNDLNVSMMCYYFIRLHQVSKWKNTTRLISPSHPTLWFIITGWFGSVFLCLIEVSRNFGSIGSLYSWREAPSSESVSQGTRMSWIREGLRSAQGIPKPLQYCRGQQLLTSSTRGLKQVICFAVFVIFQPQGFIITIITRVQTNISSYCELVHEKLRKHVKQIPQRI